MKKRVYRVLTLLLVCLLQTVASMAADETGNGQKDLFISTRISDNKPFAGEAVELTYTLFFKGIAPKILDTAKPSHEGIWAEEAAPPILMPSKPERFGKMLYRSAVIKRMKLVPLYPGKASVTGYRVLCIVPKNLSIGSGSEPDDSLTLAAPGINLDVIPLPEPEPAGFSGAVGKFSVHASADKDTVSEGSPLQLTTIISGKGSFLAFSDIPLSVPDGFTRLDRPTSSGFNGKPELLAESLRKTVTLKAEKKGSFTFSPFSFTAFDPESKTYTTVEANKLTLTVVPAAGNMNAEKSGQLHKASSQDAGQGGQLKMLNRLLFALPFALALALLYFLLKKRSSRTPLLKPANSLQELRMQLFSVIDRSFGFEPGKHTRNELIDVLKKQEIDENVVRKLLAVLDEFDRLEFAPGEPEADDFENLRLECKTLYPILRSRPSR